MELLRNVLQRFARQSEWYKSEKRLDGNILRKFLELKGLQC